MKKIFFITVMIFMTTTLGSCERNSDKIESPNKYAFMMLENISYVSGKDIKMRGDSIIITVKDSFTLYDPFFAEEISWWLAHDLFNKYQTIGTVYYFWEFSNNGKDWKSQEYAQREGGMQLLEQRYSSKKYYDLLGEQIKQKKFRQYVIELFHLYGAVLSADTTGDFKHIYNENIFNVFSMYTATCNNSLAQKEYKQMLAHVDNLAKKYGNGDGGYSSTIIHEILELCEKKIVTNPENIKSKMHLFSESPHEKLDQ